MNAENVQELSMKNNLIQNFYVIGYSLEDFFILKSYKKAVFAEILKEPEKFEISPKLISKFPNFESNNNPITDDLIISHCFPKGFKVIKDINPQKVTHFEFILDNIPANYNEDEKSLYSEIYFNCLEFYEPLSQYVKLKREIIENSQKNRFLIENVDKKEQITEETEKQFQNYFIPKVICLASLLPFGNEMKQILYNIYNYYLANSKNSSLIPLEKLLEQLIIKIPNPVSSNAEISVSFKLNDPKAPNTNLNFDKIVFPVYNLKEAYIQNYQSLSFWELFNYFSVENLIKIFRYMVLEVPLLFFSSDKSALSLFVDNFLSLLTPFVYVLPHISILPNELYGLINSEPKFIFGINENYTENFFIENNIDLDKTIVVVNLKEKKNESEIKDKVNKMEDSECLVINEQTKKKDNDRNTDDYIFFNGSYVNLLNIDFPSSHKKKIVTYLNSLVSSAKKKYNLANSKELISQKFNYNVQHIFFKFFIYIMSGYSDYLLNSKFFGNYIKIKNLDYNIRYKNVDRDFIKELFNLDEFISNHSKDNQLFYSAFCNTKLFMNYFREKVFSNNILDIVRREQFDQFIYLKKHKDARKKKENKGIYENFRKFAIESDVIKQSIEVTVTNELHFSQSETLEILKDINAFTALSKYGQLIQGKAKKGKNFELPTLNYFVFPKLLFDNSFFKDNYEKLLTAHCLTLPDGALLEDVKKKSIEYSELNTKEKKYMNYEDIIKNLPQTNNSQENFEIRYISYIYFTWLMLLSCSLWYCEPIERNIRINKIFELLNKLEYIEEQVLLFLFINIYKYGDKYQFIKMHKINLKFVGYSNYFFLNLLYNKLKEKDEEIEDQEDKGNANNIIDEKEENEEEEKDYEYSLKKRYLIDTSGRLIKSLLSKNIPKYTKRKVSNANNVAPDNEIISQDKEEIVFSTEQFCQKCGNIINLNPEDLMKNILDPELEYFTYKCEKCQGVGNEINIKYHILLSNFQKKEAIVMGEGEFKLNNPYKFYQNIKNYFKKSNNYELDIENIFNEKELNLPNIIFYFSIINLSFDFLLPYKDEEEKNKKKVTNKNANEFVPIKINYDNDDVYRRFNNLVPIYNPRRRYFRRNYNSIQSFSILAEKKKK